MVSSSSAINFVAGLNRCLTIYKPNTNTLISYDATLEMSTESANSIKRFLVQNRVSDREISEAQELGINKVPKQYYYGFAIFKLSVPPRITISCDIIDTHLKLPITNFRDGIINMINKNRVVVISGDTGSGKVIILFYLCCTSSGVHTVLIADHSSAPVHFRRLLS